MSGTNLINLTLWIVRWKQDEKFPFHLTSPLQTLARPNSHMASNLVFPQLLVPLPYWNLTQFYGLNFTRNCTVASSWYHTHHLDWAGASFGYGNESINIKLLRMALGPQIQIEIDDVIGDFYDGMANISYSADELQDINAAIEGLTYEYISGDAFQFDSSPRDVSYLDSTKAQIEYSCIAAELANYLNPTTPVLLSDTTNLSTKANDTDTNSCVDFFILWNSFRIEANNTDLALGEAIYSSAQAVRSSLLPDVYQNISNAELYGWLGGKPPSSDSFYDYISGIIDGWTSQLSEIVNLTNVNSLPFIPTDDCIEAVCAGFISGNQDLAGIGVFISYIIQAGLATLIVIATCWQNRSNWKIRKQICRSDHIPVIERARSHNVATIQEERHRFSGAIGAFLDTALFFLLSLIVARAVDGFHDYSVYNHKTVLLASHFASDSLCLVAIIPGTVSNRSRPFWITWYACLLASAIISVKINMLHPDGILHMSPDLFCFGIYVLLHKVGSLVDYTSLFPTFDLVVYSCCIPLYVGFSIGFSRLRDHASGKWKRASKNCKYILSVLRYVFTLLVFVDMWIALYILARFRNIEKEVGGSSDTDQSFSYGQILALFAWVPVGTTLFNMSATHELKKPTFSNSSTTSHAPPVLLRNGSDKSLLKQTSSFDTMNKSILIHRTSSWSENWSPVPSAYDVKTKHYDHAYQSAPV